MCLICWCVCRNNSTKDLENFAETAISINRMMQQHIHISLSQAHSFFHSHSSTAISRRRTDSTTTVAPNSASSNSSTSGDEHDDFVTAAILESLQSGLQLSPPGGSKLAKRRATLHACGFHSSSGSGDSFTLTSSTGSWRT